MSNSVLFDTLVCAHMSSFPIEVTSTIGCYYVKFAAQPTVPFVFSCAAYFAPFLLRIFGRICRSLLLWQGVSFTLCICIRRPKSSSWRHQHQQTKRNLKSLLYYSYYATWMTRNRAQRGDRSVIEFQKSEARLCIACPPKP